MKGITIAVNLSLYFLLIACTKERRSTDVLGVRKIWSNNTYCAFTDLIKHKESWYCVFREAASHEGTNGYIRVLKSNNTLEWMPDTILSVSNIDLRDPKLIVGFNGELIIYSAAKGTILKNVMWTLNNANNKWATFSEFNVTGDWLWRIKQHESNMYSVGYTVHSRRPMNSEISLYNSTRNTFPNFTLSKKAFASKGCPTESSILLQPNSRNMLLLTRRDCDDMQTYLGIAPPPYDSVQWNSLNMVLQSPNMIYVGDEIYVSGRAYNPGDETALYKLHFDDMKLEKLATFPSKIDTGYPGMHYENGILSISYYSLEPNGSTAIYLCNYKIQ